MLKHIAAVLVVTKTGLALCCACSVQINSFKHNTQAQGLVTGDWCDRLYTADRSEAVCTCSKHVYVNDNRSNA
ncbi:hypothetical protein RRG08_021016 [Elysia crispata]|uniref:Secreted protein n=1 Tax=Elysia crispata TaxID=231223 RepID=A0AAE1BGU1_9GAST|nr:hypothetical protein RRG08_021016 [Elysia crispata]